MVAAGGGPVAGRILSLLALAVPVLAGIAYMAASGAPAAFLAINAGALAGGLLLVAFGGGLLAPLSRHRRAAQLVLLALFTLPLLTGPSVNGITRWLDLPLPGGIVLHSGMLVLPLLVALTAEDPADAPVVLLAAMLVALLQPDAASVAALALAAVGLARAWGGWQVPLVAAIGLPAMIIATLRGELPPQPFVERVVADALLTSPPLGLALMAAQFGAFLLIAFDPARPPANRWALGGSLFGFAIMAMMNVYPAPLLGYGAAAIIGYAVALAHPTGHYR